MDRPITPIGINYRRMTESDLDAAHRLSQQVRWPHQRKDWQFVLEIGTGYVAEAGGELIGSAMCWQHGPQFASLGMVIVSPGWQGKGIARKLTAMAIDDLGARTVFLNGTAAGQALYEEMGFRATGTIRQHQGSVFKSKLIALKAGERIRPLGARDGAKLVELGARALGMPRGQVLAALMESAECVVIDRDDELLGCAIMRRFGHGYAIGPVIAADAERAKALIAHWAGSYAGSFVRVDVNDDGALSPWLDEIGLTQVDTVTTMMRGAPPAGDTAMRQFAIVSQALG